MEDPTLKGPFGFIFRGAGVPIFYYLPLAPQHFAVSLPARGQIHQTLESNFLDDFSGPRAVLAHVTIRGTFGYDVKGGGIGVPMPGSLHLRTLELLYETFNAMGRQLKAKIRATTEFVALSRLFFWQVWIDRFDYRITNQDPLLYYYEISMRRLQDYLSPAAIAQQGASALPSSTALPGATGLGALF